MVKALTLFTTLVLTLSGCVAFVPLVEPDSQAKFGKKCAPCEQARHEWEMQDYKRKSSGERSEIYIEKRLQKLVYQLEHGTEANRTHAAYWLGEMGQEAKSALPQLIASLKHKSHWVRRASVKALGKIKDREAIESLKSATRDRDRFVSESARRALLNFDENKLALNHRFLSGKSIARGKLK